LSGVGARLFWLDISDVRAILFPLRIDARGEIADGGPDRIKVTGTVALRYSIDL